MFILDALTFSPPCTSLRKNNVKVNTVRPLLLMRHNLTLHHYNFFSFFTSWIPEDPYKNFLFHLVVLGPVKPDSLTELLITIFPYTSKVCSRWSLKAVKICQLCLLSRSGTLDPDVHLMFLILPNFKLSFRHVYLSIHVIGPLFECRILSLSLP